MTLAPAEAILNSKNVMGRLSKLKKIFLSLFFYRTFKTNNYL